ncbi:hypothetical protein F66182_15609, partial [Fusarium sp. NRRL 66182]
MRCMNIFLSALGLCVLYAGALPTADSGSDTISAAAVATTSTTPSQGDPSTDR